MKTQLLNALAAAILLLMPIVTFGNGVVQPPILGATSSFALFTAAGAFNVTGASTVVTGDVGNYTGAFNGFPPGTLNGVKHVGDPLSAQAAADVANAYAYLSGLTCGASIGTTLGGGQILTPNIYCQGAATTLDGNLILDAQGNPDALFIFQIGGAFATTSTSNVSLINSASLCNVYWQINGEFDVHGTSVFRGTVIANGAIHLTETASLLGRGLSTAGAISLENNIVTQNCSPSVPIPTLSQWGLIICGILLLGAGTIYILRKKQASIRI
jgi:hypothetical protein